MEIIGRKCESLVAREFWLSGELVTPLCVVFLEDDRGERWKLYLNDEDNTWKMESTNEDPNEFQGDDEYQYPITDLLEKYQVRGEVVEDFSEWDAGSGAKAKITFKSGTALEFTHDYTSEEDSIAIRRDR